MTGPRRSRVSPQELVKTQAQAQLQLRKEETATNVPPLMEYIPILSPRWEEPQHLKPVIEALTRVLTEGNQRIIISIPPRHGKTETLLHFMAWYLRQRQHHTLAYISYSSTFTDSKITKAQELCLKAGVIPNERLQNKSEWRTTDGGGLLANGIGGPLTGHGVNVLIIDDPIKNREEAESQLIRDKQWGWFEDVAETRIEPGGSIIILMTRWHEDDLSGRAQNEREFDVIRIPALCDGLDVKGNAHYQEGHEDEEEFFINMDPNGRELGEPLWPMRYKTQWFLDIQEKKPVTFTSLYQGLPRNKGDRIFGEPHYYDPREEQFRKGYKIGNGIDLAYSEKRHANHSAFVNMARKADTVQIHYATKWRTTIDKTIPKLRELQRLYPATLRAEANGPQKGVIDSLKRNKLRILGVQPRGDKYSRAIDFAEAWNSGLVMVPRGAPWLEDFLEQLVNFTGLGDAEDDYVDAAVYAFQSVRGGRFMDEDFKGPDAAQSYSTVGTRIDPDKVRVMHKVRKSRNGLTLGGANNV